MSTAARSGPFRIGFYMETLDQVPAVLRADNVTIFELPGGRGSRLTPLPLEGDASAGEAGSRFWSK
jgi:hypothetical protein